MSSKAIETQGTQLHIGSDVGDSPIVYTQVKEMVSFQAFDGQAAEIDTTSLDSTAKEFLMGLQDFGQYSGDWNFVDDDPGQVLMRTAKGSRTVKPFKLQLSNGKVFLFNGYVQGAPISGGVDAKTDGSFTIRITGEVVGPVAA